MRTHDASPSAGDLPADAAAGIPGETGARTRTAVGTRPLPGCRRTPGSPRAPRPRRLRRRQASRAAAQRAGRAGDTRGHHRGDRRARHRRRELRGRRGAGRGRQGDAVPALARQGGPADRGLRRAQAATAAAAGRVGPGRPDRDARGHRRRRRRPPVRAAVRAAARRGRALPPAGGPVQGARGRAPPRADEGGAPPRRRPTASSAPTPTWRSRCSRSPARSWPAASTTPPGPTPASPPAWSTSCCRPRLPAASALPLALDAQSARPPATRAPSLAGSYCSPIRGAPGSSGCRSSAVHLVRRHVRLRHPAWVMRAVAARGDAGAGAPARIRRGSADMHQANGRAGMTNEEQGRLQQAETRGSVASLGALPERAAVGDGPGGPRPGRQHLGGVPLRPGGLPGLPVGRGRAGGHQRRQAAAVPVAGPVERARPDAQGAAVRPHQLPGQPRRGRQGVLLLPRRDADVVVPEDALQVPAARVPLRRPGRDQRGAGEDRARIRAGRHRDLRRQPLLRRLRRVREGLARKTFSCRSPCTTGDPTRRGCTCCPRSGSGTPGPGRAATRSRRCTSTPTCRG